MSFKGLFTVFGNALKSFKGIRSFKGITSNLKGINRALNKGVLQEGGKTSLFCYKLGFWGGFCLPGGTIFAPLTGATGALVGKTLAESGKQSFKIAKKCVSIFT
jgi:hypothetical protein